MNLTETKHTPGPWELTEHEDSPEYIVCGGPEEKYVCTVRVHQIPREMGLYDEPERKANAKLIAAAPDLLKALIMIDECLRDGLEIEKDDHLHAVISDLIQKATS